MGKSLEIEYGSKAFVCPFCGVNSQQHWHSRISGFSGIYKYKMGSEDNCSSSSDSSKILKDLSICQCENCEKYSIWINKKMVYPLNGNVPLPNEDMPKDVKKDYMEARSIVNLSPRGACALLRLALDKLMDDLNIEGSSLNDKLNTYSGNRNVNAKLIKAFHAVRIVGNESVHIGTLDIDDNVHIATALLGILNIIVEETITEEKKVDEVFKLLPEEKTKNINYN